MEKLSLNNKINDMNKEIVVLQSNNSNEISKLQDEIQNLDTDLKSALNKIATFEIMDLQNDNTAELEMNLQQIAELQQEIKLLKSCRGDGEERVSQLEGELMDALQLSETLQAELESKQNELVQNDSSSQGLSNELVALKEKLTNSERLLEEATAELTILNDTQTDLQASILAEQEAKELLQSELDASKQQVAELSTEISSMRTAHESYVTSSDNKLDDLNITLQEKEASISCLKSELSTITTSSTSDKMHLEQQLQEEQGTTVRLAEQSKRDAERIEELEAIISSDDSNEQITLAQKKISDLEHTLTEREIGSTNEIKSINDRVTELKIELSNEKQSGCEQVEKANNRCKELQVTLDQVQMEMSMLQTQTEKEIGELSLQLAETDKLRGENSRLNNNINTLQSQISDLTSNYQAEQEKLRKLEIEIEDEHLEHSNLVSSLENNIDELETRVATLNNDKEGVEECLARREKETQATISRLEEEIEKLKEKVLVVETHAEDRIGKLEAQLGQVRYPQRFSNYPLFGLSSLLRSGRKAESIILINVNFRLTPSFQNGNPNFLIPIPLGRVHPAVLIKVDFVMRAIVESS